jgi:hypothetical protein
MMLARRSVEQWTCGEAQLPSAAGAEQASRDADAGPSDPACAPTQLLNAIDRRDAYFVVKARLTPNLVSAVLPVGRRDRDSRFDGSSFSGLSERGFHVDSLRWRTFGRDGDRGASAPRGAGSAFATCPARSAALRVAPGPPSCVSRKTTGLSKVSSAMDAPPA